MNFHGTYSKTTELMPSKEYQINEELCMYILMEIFRFICRYSILTFYKSLFSTFLHLISYRCSDFSWEVSHFFVLLFWMRENARKRFSFESRDYVESQMMIRLIWVYLLFHSNSVIKFQSKMWLVSQPSSFRTHTQF